MSDCSGYSLGNLIDHLYGGGEGCPKGGRPLDETLRSWEECFKGDLQVVNEPI